MNCMPHINCSLSGLKHGFWRLKKITQAVACVVNINSSFIHKTSFPVSEIEKDRNHLIEQFICAKKVEGFSDKTEQ